MKLSHLHEAKYYKSNNVPKIRKYIEEWFYIWGEKHSSEKSFMVTIEESGTKYDIFVSINQINVDPQYPEDWSNKRAQEIQKELESVR